MSLALLQIFSQGFGSIDPHLIDCILVCAYVEKVWRRASVGDAGPLGGDFPIVTSDGHNILDVIFTTPIPSLGNSFGTLQCSLLLFDMG